MKVKLCAMAALVSGLALAAPHREAAAQAPGQIPAGYAYYNYNQPEMYNYDPHMPSPAPPPSVGGMATAASPCGCGGSGCTDGCTDGCANAWAGSCNGSCGGSCSGGCGLLSKLSSFRMGNRKGCWFAGADFLYLRADLSEATVWVEQDTANFVETFHQADFDYDASYRFFGGYRFSDCCGEVLLSYARYSSESNMVSPDATVDQSFMGPSEVNAIGDGNLTSDIDIDADIFDVDFARTLPLGSPLGECGSCNWCPAWDIKWFFGARYADVEWTRGVTTDQTAAQVTSSRTQMSFDGIGPRFGIDGRRYIGRNGNFSVFAKGAISVLLGDVDYVTNIQTVTVGGISSYTASFTRVIPVTEIEVGGSLHLSNNLTVSAGYLLSAWHDLGMGDEHFVGSTVGPAVYDDANILGFDGAFARAEFVY